MAMPSRRARLDPPPRRVVTAAAGIGAVLLVAVLASAQPGARPSGSIATPAPTGTPEDFGSPSAVAAASATAAGSAPAATSTSTAGASPTPAPSPAPTSATTWASIVLPPIQLAAELTADDQDAAGLALDTTFTLRSLTGTPAMELAARVETQPFLALRAELGADATTVRLRPAEPLAPGTSYRFLLRGTSGALLGSWAFQAKQPLHVVSTLPGNESTGVPLDTGIEITFDQDGVTAAADHFAIEPAVRGRFEQHDRTLVFVPASDLAAETVYTVTVRRGVAIAGSDQVLESDVVFAFETAGSTPEPEGFAEDRIGRPVFESASDEAPVLGMTVYREGPAPDSVAVRVHRLPSATAAVEAARMILTAPTWARWSTKGLVPTAGLPRVLAFDGRLESIDASGGFVIRFPTALDPGWYLVVLPVGGRDLQALLQVSDVAVYVMATETRTVAWVNDVATGRPLSGAIATAGGARLGATGPDGLLVTATPAELRRTDWEAVNDEPSIVIATAPDGRAAIAALGAPSGPMYAQETRDIAHSDEATERYWLVLGTDRTYYRTSDTVNAFGVARERATGTVPADVEVRLTTRESSDVDGRSPAIAAVHATPDERGMFAASISFADLPLGGYLVELWTGDRLLATVYLTIADIRKPAYSVEIATDRRGYVAGETITATASVAFFDGTRAPGVELAFDGARATTDAAGIAAVKLPASTDGATEGWQSLSVSAAPADPEEGEIAGWAPIAVFPAAWWIAASGAIADGALRLSGTLTELDRERIERELEERDTVTDPSGLPVPSGPLTATIIELVPVRTEIGRTYDFIAKRSVPLYFYEIREDVVGRRDLTTSADGTFGLSLPLAAPGHTHRVVLTARDPARRQIRLTVEVAPAVPAVSTFATRPFLGDGPVCGYDLPKLFRIAEPVSLTFRGVDGPLPAGDGSRYLFTVSRQGLVDTTLQASPTFSRGFAETEIPNATIAGVWFTGRGYVPAANHARVAIERSERALTITLTPDRERYRPGDEVTLTVRTVDRFGRPIPASVVLRAVDEKLFAIGAATDLDLLGELYRSVQSGILGTYASHQPPFPSGFEGCGDTTGGGGDDFRDWLLFRQLATGPDGTARVSFPLSDDLTSWHISAAAVSGDLEAGAGSVLVPVGLPFFVEAVLAPEYLVDDRPVLRLRGFGADLAPGDAVRFTVASSTLGLAPVTVDGAAFEAIEVPLPPLSLGVHRISISGESGSGTSRKTYDLTRGFTVVAGRVIRTETRIDPLTADWTPSTANGLTTVSVTDAGRGRFLAVLGALAGGDGARLDQSLAAAVARDLLVEAFGQPEWTLPPPSFDPARYETSRGLTLLPYAGPDLLLTVRAVLAAPERFEPYLLREALGTWLFGTATTREQRSMVLAALIALGEPVLADAVRLRAEPDLTVRELLYLGMAFAGAGDDAAASAIARELLEAHGQRLGPWVRLSVGSSLDASLEATGLLALLLAAVGDPLAADAEAYLEANPGHDDLFVLHQLAYVRRALERADPQPGRFAVTITGDRQVHDLAPGTTWTLTLAPSQLATLRLEPLTGELTVSVRRTVPFDPSSAPVDADVSIERAVVPTGDLPGDQLVRVTLTVRFGPQATSACYEVNDRLPSGLAPLVRSAGADDEGDEARDALAPYLVEGQRVAWCVAPERNKREFVLAYRARVVSPGTYRWESATVQSSVGGDRVSSMPPATITIR